MKQYDQPSERIHPREAAIRPVFRVVCLGLLLMTPADLAQKTPALAMALVWVVLAITLASVLRGRWWRDGVTGKNGRMAAILEEVKCFGEDARAVEATLAAPRRRPLNVSHQVWSRADGFTLSGTRTA